MKKTIHSEAQTEFCKMLRDAREQRKLTQEVLAERLGRHQSFVAKVEKGERRLDVIEFVRYSGALEVNPAQLISRLQKLGAIWD